MSKDVSNSLLASEINTSKESSEKVKGNFGGPGGFNPMESSGIMKEFYEK